MTKIKIEDGSGDRDFFTIIPNYILNHSTHWDREVYTQMKRIAGDNGKCYMSIPNLAKKCGMGKERLNKSIQYLIEHKWIKFLGKIPVMTRGGEQFANTYKIENIWKLNTDFYKGGSPQGYPQDKGGSPQTSKGGRQRGVATGSLRRTNINKNHINKNHIAVVKTPAFFTEVKNYFIHSYKGKFGKEPAIDFGKDGKVVNKVKGLFRSDEWKKLIDDFLNSNKAKELGYSLSICFSTHTINTWQTGNLDKFISNIIS